MTDSELETPPSDAEHAASLSDRLAVSVEEFDPSAPETADLEDPPANVRQLLIEIDRLRDARAKLWQRLRIVRPRRRKGILPQIAIFSNRIHSVKENIRQQTGLDVSQPSNGPARLVQPGSQPVGHETQSHLSDSPPPATELDASGSTIRSIEPARSVATPVHGKSHAKNATTRRVAGTPNDFSKLYIIRRECNYCGMPISDSGRCPRCDIRRAREITNVSSGLMAVAGTDVSMMIRLGLFQPLDEEALLQSMRP